MPYKKPYKKRRYKRRYKRKATFNKKLLGNTLATTLVYNEQYSLDAGISPSIATQVMSANGMFDPNITGVGHQPRGFDELMALYDHFVVVGSKITLKVPSGANTHMVGVALRDSTSVENSLVNYQEGRNVVSKMFSPDAGRAEVITYGFSAKRFLGRASPLSDPELKGSASSNPLEGAYFHIFTGHPNSGSNPQSIALDCTIEYRVVLLEPNNPGQS